MFDLAAADLTALFTAELELCAVATREVVVILTEPASRGDYAAAAFASVKELHAHAVQITLPGGSPVELPSTRTGTGYGLRSLDDTPPVLDLLRSADMVIDLTLEGSIHTPTLSRILQADTRVLFVCEPPDVLARNLPEQADKDRARQAAKMIAGARSMHVTSPVGTDLTADLTDSHPGFQCGFTDDPGRWDHWPSTMALCWPSTDGIEGTLVLDRGDIIFPFKQYVTEPVTLTIRQGTITAVDGGIEAFLLTKFFDDSNDPAARRLSHMGWGLMHSADWLALGMYDKETIMGMDGRAAAGNFLISTGPQPFEDRWTPYHLDLPLLNCTVSLDHTLVTKHGNLIP
ncbi:MAG: 2,5-dihydroxypyridine 5,6-dioxygenase [Actinoallomurus sp.]